MGHVKCKVEKLAEWGGDLIVGGKTDVFEFDELILTVFWGNEIELKVDGSLKRFSRSEGIFKLGENLGIGWDFSAF